MTTDTVISYYRVFAITNYRNRPEFESFKIKISAPTYCTPSTIFWLTESGLENPNCALIQIIHKHSNSDVLWQKITFEYGGNTYTGIFSFQSFRTEWANDTQCDAMIQNIVFLNNAEAVDIPGGYLDDLEES